MNVQTLRRVAISLITIVAVSISLRNLGRLSKVAKMVILPIL